MGDDDEAGLKPRTKLQCKALDMYRVVAAREQTVVIDTGGALETGSRDRVSLAPPDPDVPTPTLAQHSDDVERDDGPPEASNSESKLPRASLESPEGAPAAGSEFLPFASVSCSMGCLRLFGGYLGAERTPTSKPTLLHRAIVRHILDFLSQRHRHNSSL